MGREIDRKSDVASSIFPDDGLGCGCYGDSIEEHGVGRGEGMNCDDDRIERGEVKNFRCIYLFGLT